MEEERTSNVKGGVARCVLGTSWGLGWAQRSASQTE